MDLTLDILQDAITNLAKKARKDSIKRRQRRNLSVPAAKWIAPAMIKGRQGYALSVVLATVGCSHAISEAGGCTMCSYLLDGTEEHPTHEQLIQQFEVALGKLEEKPVPYSVKIYTSGSFLDTREVSIIARKAILEKIGRDERIEEVVLESRPEYVSDSLMHEVKSILGDRKIEIGIGLESTNDQVRSLCINKGFTLDKFQEALEICKTHGIGIRAYVLVKPPFLTERDALLDSVSTIIKAAEMGITTASINPVNVQSYTLVERLWRSRDYRPPWLWTVVEILKQARKEVNHTIPILCDPVAAGKSRGTHNCGICDSSIIQAIRSFSLSQDLDVFDDLSCGCRNLWEHVLTHEDISLVSHL
ncbi:MAG: hypothetical protein BAJATHORv1_10456 [Candidatus Thorarchaeota archaeon]|nr:MAG: hypothetical protein BAJATHORv1_10456 [Candidatus Thorarchaeota archaeon]